MFWGYTVNGMILVILFDSRGRRSFAERFSPAVATVDLVFSFPSAHRSSRSIRSEILLIWFSHFHPHTGVSRLLP
jgi:hypothetical protein